MTEALRVLLEQWTHHLWAVSWQVSILFLIIWIIEKLSFRASSLFRYWLWMIVLIRLCIPVNLAIPGGLGQRIIENIGIGSSSLQNNIMNVDPSPLEFAVPEFSPSSEFKTADNNATVQPVEHYISNSLSDAAGIAWLVSIILICAVILYRIAWINRRLSQCKPVGRADICELFQRLKVDLGLKDSIGLYFMDIDNVDVPSVIGVLYPKVFLPRSIAEKWSAEEIEPILLHELAHIKHNDHIVNFLQVIIQVVYFFHPAVWIVNRRIRKLREQLCDDLAIYRLGNQSKRYSQSILRVMENIVEEPAFGFIGIGFSERKSITGERIKRVMDANYINKTKMTSLSVIMVIIIGTAGLFVSCGQSNNIIKGEVNDSKKLNIPEIIEEAEFVIVSGKGSYIYTQIVSEKVQARALELLYGNDHPLRPESSNMTNLTTNRYYSYAFDGPNSVLYKFNNQEHEYMENKTIHNGEISKQISYRYDDKDYLPVQGIVTSKQIGDPAMDNPFFYITDFLAIILNMYHNDSSNIVLSNKYYNGFACDVITLEDEENNIKYAIWISPNLEYSVVKIEYGTFLSQERKDEILFEYVQYKDYYIPNNIVRNSYQDGEFASKHIITFEDDWVFNIDIIPEEFTIDFPSGLRVYDESIGGSYIVD